MEQQVRGLGIPFVNTKDYARNIMFSGLDVTPATSDPEVRIIYSEKRCCYCIISCLVSATLYVQYYPNLW